MVKNAILGHDNKKKQSSKLNKENNKNDCFHEKHAIETINMDCFDLASLSI